ncbi:isopenicillin N epimerase [Sporothrix schenckii 1099-18]|uniref:Aminotransferase class V domain-containing protein n=2 Tax=Sporothrix schenckii TaxID=29908 RepID=U7PP91_SPOS1|nr:isopenicillin N epimerase [Sporothrix schenckii 1099-18]ERS96766.1 hypothetical protein HMPREF1624_06975 [Sporothrix schenckii ATCC 58251]KJR81490.1 isopenicillin N epimerase [Sporothrix schenckii 1099-18]
MGSTATDSAPAPTGKVAFGKPMRALFPFAPTYRNLNHGSYGTYPSAIGAVRAQFLADHEARAEIHKRLDCPELVRKARVAFQPLLGDNVNINEVVMVANATTGVNVVLRNLAVNWSAPVPDAGDAVLYFTSIYEACDKTLQSLAEAGRVHNVKVHVSFPADDDDAVVQKLRDAYAAATARGLTVRLAIFDTIVSAPGVLLPWERLVAACRELGILSLLDAAHAIGHLDLTHLGDPDVSPDFFVSNLHKWLFVPRGCAMLYVPFRNQHLLATSLPTSHGYQKPGQRGDQSTEALRALSTASSPPPDTYFTNLFAEVGTLDYSPWLCVPAAVQFREEVCGGEKAIRDYCFDLVRKGSDRVAAKLGTEVMDNPRSNIRACYLNNVRLPFKVSSDGNDDTDPEAVPLNRFEEMLGWLTAYSAKKYDTYFRITYYEGHPWVRLSGQVYLEPEDFDWAGDVLLDLVAQIKTGDWKKKAD